MDLEDPDPISRFFLDLLNIRNIYFLQVLFSHHVLTFPQPLSVLFVLDQMNLKHEKIHNQDNLNSFDPMSTKFLLRSTLSNDCYQQRPPQ